MTELPQALTTVRTPMPDDLPRGAVESLGSCGRASRRLLDAGLVPPDVLTGMTLFLLASQPRRPRPDGRRPAGAVAGGVWVREQVTIHQPVRLAEELVVTGESARRFSRRGRRYGVTTSETRAADGRLLVSSCTTGLLRYRKQEGLEDASEGRAEQEIAVFGPDPAGASSNPALPTLRSLVPGDRIEGERSRVTLLMMRVRDKGRGDNPIHTDPEVARREGLAAPIAGGSHVLAFLHEALMRAWGPESLLHGAHFDVQWKGQTFAGASITPHAVVVSATPELVELSLQIEGEERTALVGTLAVPLA